MDKPYIATLAAKINTLSLKYMTEINLRKRAEIFTKIGGLSVKLFQLSEKTSSQVLKIAA